MHRDNYGRQGDNYRGGGGGGGGGGSGYGGGGSGYGAGGGGAYGGGAGYDAGGAAARYGPSRPDPRSGQSTAATGTPAKDYLSAAEVLRKLALAGAARRNDRFGSAGHAVSVVGNCFTANLSDTLGIIEHYDITYETQEPEGGGRGGRGGRGRGGRGRGRGRGGRGGGGRGGMSFKLDDRPLPICVATQLIQNIQNEYGRSDFNGNLIAHDGRKNAYTTSAPSFKDQGFRSFYTEWDGTKYKVTFKCVNQVDMRNLLHYTKDGTVEVPQECVTALDIVLRTAPMRQYLYTGRGFAIAPERDHAMLRLGDGCEAWTSYYQAFRPKDNGMYLTFDVTYSAIYTSQTLYDFAVEVLAPPGAKENTPAGECALPYALTPMQIKKLENSLRHLRIYNNTLPLAERKMHGVRKVTEQPASRMDFENDLGRSMTVADHFADSGNALNFPHLPCVTVGGKSVNLIPLEKCTIEPGQRRKKPLTPEMKERMAEIGARSPISRMEIISDGLKKISKETQEYLEAFGVRVNAERVLVPARILEPPHILLGRKVEIDLTRNENHEHSWSIKNQFLYQTPNSLTKWGVLVLANMNKRDVWRFIECVMMTAKSCGIEIEKPRVKFGFRPIVQKNMTALKSEVEEDKGSCQLMMVIKPDTGTRDYNQIKNVSDTYLGIPSQCVVEGNARDPKVLYCMNLVLKINNKLGGVNHRIPGGHFSKLGDNFCVMGASVVHSPSLSKSEAAESVAAVVGSVDKRCGRYAGAFRKQDGKVAGIPEMGEMAAEVLSRFYQSEKFLPDNILFYRNGVADGQFVQVIDEELKSVRSCLTKMAKEDFEIDDYKPKITFIIAQRGHHTRFTPEDSKFRDMSGNVVPGTVIDRDVLHPTLYDFFLISHNGIQGVSRPLRYTILMDDMGFEPDEIQKLTNDLCYTFGRATRSISMVPPVVYADLLATRMRACISARTASTEPGLGPNEPTIQRDALPQEFTKDTPKMHDNLWKRQFYV